MKSVVSAKCVRSGKSQVFFSARFSWNPAIYYKLIMYEMVEDTTIHASMHRFFTARTHDSSQSVILLTRQCFHL